MDTGLISRQQTDEEITLSHLYTPVRQTTFEIIGANGEIAHNERFIFHFCKYIFKVVCCRFVVLCGKGIRYVTILIKHSCGA